MKLDVPAPLVIKSFVFVLTVSVSITDIFLTSSIAILTQHGGHFRFQRETQVTPESLLSIKAYGFKKLPRNPYGILDKISHFWFVPFQFNHRHSHFLVS